MISVAHGAEYRKGGVVFFTGTEEIPCPICQGKLRVRGTCMRKLHSSEGRVLYRLRVMECRKCGKTHRELPFGIVPYKRMDADLLSDIAETPQQSHLEVAETSTWRRVWAWVRWFIQYSLNILTAMQAEYPGILTGLPGGPLRRQLTYFVRLVVNSGNWVQHRSALTST